MSARHGLRAPFAALALSAGLLGLALPVAGCPLPAGATPAAGGQPLAQGPVQLAWRAEPAELAVGRPFALVIQLCPAPARLLRVDATMPEHRHGMNYRPSVKPLGESQWRADGLLWHMAGRWELAFEVENGSERMWLRQSIVLH